MKRILITLQAAFLVLGLVAGQAAWADNGLPEPAEMAAESGNTLFTAAELDELLAPIALYPDPLIAQILPAATFIDQIDEAARYVKQYGKAAQIDDQPWDVSVRAVAHYPDVLYMMDQKYDWTVSLGQAFVDQQQEVMDAIQRLRARAEEVGSLTSTPQQQVVVDDDLIRIVPAEPEVIYVPQYDPLMVYAEPPYPAYGFITFGIGFTIGAWLNRDCDWHRHRVYYHGWQGGGWISRARPHIHDRRGTYINNRFASININRRVMQHDTVRFREDIRTNLQNRRGQITTPPVQPRSTAPRDRGESRGWQPTPGTPAQRPVNRDVYRGREIPSTQSVPFSGYGGYGSSKEIKTYRERGQTSRENLQQFNRQQTAPRPSPTQRPAISGSGQPASRPAMQPAPRSAPPAVQRAPQPAQQPSRGWIEQKR